MKFERYTVQELIDMDMLEEPLDGNHGSLHPKASDYVSSGIPFIMANNLVDGDVDLINCAFITEEQARTLRKGFSKSGDVLLTHKATIGRTAIVPEKYETVILTPQVTYYRVKKGIDNRFLKYYFDSPDFQATLNNWAGAGSTRAYLGIIAQHKLLILLPQIEEQRKIADVLWALDEKIKMNKMINKNLEEQAQAIFYHYFINCKEIPCSWQEGSLLDIADFLNGLAMQKFRPQDDKSSLPVLKIKELRQGACDADSDRCSTEIKHEYIIHDGDVIFSWSGSLLVDFWCGGQCGLNQHLFKVTSAKYDQWLYYSWTKYHLREFVAMAADKATTMGHIKRDALEKARVLIPSHEDYVRIGDLLQPIYDAIIANRVANRELANLRDTLLPRLMSGEIDVSSIEL